ncbi:hypothetical protein [Paraburkholderia fungorum]|jgi:hypothetical protein
MVEHMDDKKQKQAEELFALATEAARAEFRRALRDPLMWVGQVIDWCFAAVKLMCVAPAFGLAAMYFIGLEKQAALELVSLPALAVFAWNPRRFFWKNLFQMRADTAFEHSLRTYR